MSRQNNKCKAQEETNMCRKIVVTNESFLGARPICYEAYSLPKGEVVELTEKQIKDAVVRQIKRCSIRQIILS